MLQTVLPFSVPMPELSAFCQKRGIRELSLFGSVLRDDFRPDSDVDVLIDLLPGSTLGWDWVDMQDELSRLLGKQADLVFADSLKNPYRRDEILRTRRVVYVV